MKARRWAMGIAAVALAFAAIVPIQRQLDAQHQREFDEELLYLPNQYLLNHATAGLHSVIADLLWLKCIQYTGEHFAGDFKFTWLDHMCTTITRLDPHFVDVYQWGGIYLAALNADSDRSIELLQEGIRNNPGQWELPFEIARTYVLNRPDDPESPRMAGLYLAMATSMGAPDFVQEWAVNLQRQHGLVDVERAMWQDILETSGDKHMREMAQRRLVEVDLRGMVELLNAAAKAYAERAGAPPQDITEMQRAGVVQGSPEDPLGGQFFVHDGVVYNTSLLDSEVERLSKPIETWLEQYKQQHGRWPESLQQLVDEEIAPGLPGYPYPGRGWTYDPETGEVT